MKDTHGTHAKGWIGVDLDGTLAVYHGWQGASHIGAPIDRMTDRVKKWLKEGKDVKIFTARVTPGKLDRLECCRAIEIWSREVFGCVLPMTHEKDPAMLELWDDRCVQVIPNTGRRADSLIDRMFAGLSHFMCKVGCHDWREGPGGRCEVCGEEDDLWNILK